MVNAAQIMPQGMYIRIANPDHVGHSGKYEARVFLMGMVMERYTAFNLPDAAEWLSKRVLKGGFDKVTIEVIEDGAPGRA
jgi:hypothetical protein